MWLHKLDIASVSHSMTRIDGQQSSAKMPYLNVINLNEFIKNEWKWDAENEKQLGKQKDCRYETCVSVKSQENKNDRFEFDANENYCSRSDLMLLNLLPQITASDTQINTRRKIQVTTSDFWRSILKTEFNCVVKWIKWQKQICTAIFKKNYK